MLEFLLFTIVLPFALVFFSGCIAELVELILSVKKLENDGMFV